MAPDEERKAGTADSDANRDQGIELGELDDEIESHDYPTTPEELVAEYGDFELTLQGGSQEFGEVFGIVVGDDEEFANAEEVRQTLRNLVGVEAVGRNEYSDRGGSTPEVGIESEHDSF